MTAQLSPTPVFKAFDNNGVPLAGGFLYSYAAGTSTPQPTYLDSTQTAPNTNPIILNARGEAAVWLNPFLTYKFNLTDSLGNTIPGYPVDNISASPSAVASFTVGPPASGVSLTVNSLDDLSGLVLNDPTPILGASQAWQNGGISAGLIGTGSATVAGAALGDFGIIALTSVLRLASAAGVVVSAPTSGVALTVNGLGLTATPALQVAGANVAGAQGLQVLGGTTGTADVALIVSDAPNVTNLFEILNTPQILGRGPVSAALQDMTPDFSTFTGTITGCTTSPTGVCTWARMGKIVVLNLPSITGTSNTTALTMTGLPAAIQPTTLTQQVFCAVVNNGVETTGLAEVNPGSGTVVIMNNALAAFTASGTKGISPSTITYLLA
jgi:hypothetical protein